MRESLFHIKNKDLHKAYSHMCSMLHMRSLNSVRNHTQVNILGLEWWTRPKTNATKVLPSAKLFTLINTSTTLIPTRRIVTNRY